MVHLTLGIGQFFGYLLGALLAAGVAVLALASAAFLAVAAIGLGVRRLIGRRRGW